MKKIVDDKLTDWYQDMNLKCEGVIFMGANFSNNMSLTEVVHQVLWERSGISKLAKHLGKSVSNISQQLNPNVDYTHFPADNLLVAMQVVANYEPLHWLARQCGFLCVPVVARSSDCELELELLKSTKEFSDVVTTYNEIMADGKVDQEEAMRFRKEAEELAAQALAMAAAVDAAVELPSLPDSLPPIPTSGTDRKQ
jgi:hypothetical protein